MAGPIEHSARAAANTWPPNTDQVSPPTWKRSCTQRINPTARAVSKPHLTRWTDRQCYQPNLDVYADLCKGPRAVP